MYERRMLRQVPRERGNHVGMIGLELRQWNLECNIRNVIPQFDLLSTAHQRIRAHLP